MATDRYQRGLDRMMELVSAGHSNTFDHVKEKIVGALIHCIPYVGFPRVLNGLTLLKEVVAERGMSPEADAD
jgi:hypothetical protein